MENVRWLKGADEGARFEMKLNIPAASLPVVWVVRGKYTSVCLSRETPRLQGAALNSSEEEAAKSLLSRGCPASAIWLQDLAEAR